MRVLMFSTDPEVLTRGSKVHDRMAEYADTFGELHIVVLARRGNSSVHRNLFVYPAAAAWGSVRLFRAWRIGRRLCRRGQFEVLTVQSPDEIGIIGLLLARRFRIPLELQIHTDIMSPQYRSASWKEWVRFWIALFLIPRADCLRVVSERVGRSIVSRISYPVSSITVLPIFTDISKYADAAADPETERRFNDYDFKMLAVGRFVDREKNFSMLIDIMREFVKICPRGLLVLVGDGPDRADYGLRIANYGLEKNVFLESWRDDLPSFYKSFDLFLSSSNYEGWGRAVVEAMAAGLAVVMTDVGLAGEVVKNEQNGRVAPVGDKSMFLAAIADLYQSFDKRKTLAAAGERTVRDLSPKTQEEYLALYKKCLLSCRHLTL